MKDNWLKFIENYNGQIVIDTGLWIEFFLDTKIGRDIRSKILDNENISEILIHDFIISEIFYIFCRNKDYDQAIKYIEDLLMIVTVVESNELRIPAAIIKCKRSISLSDAYTCSISLIYQIPVLFKDEKELVKEIEKEEFEFDLYLI